MGAMDDLKKTIDGWRLHLDRRPMFVGSETEYLEFWCDVELWHFESDETYWARWLYWTLVFVGFARQLKRSQQEPKFFDTSYVWKPADR
jgi:hypothetical protein